jgi:hypothetical protein
MENFSEYKKTIESNLINFSYLYDGDVIDSTLYTYESYSNNSKYSPIIIIDCINKIYDQSITEMMSRDLRLVNVINNNIDDIITVINSVKFDTNYVFFSGNASSLLTRYLIQNNKNRPFPTHFYKTIEMSHLKYDLYKSPNIIDSSDEIVIYLTDKSIQSLVYTIQNIEYEIIKSNQGYKHIITYNLYNCDYNVCKLVIKDISKIRSEKINKILC